MSNEDREKRLKALEDFAFNVDKIVKQPAPVSKVKERRDEIKELLQKRQTERLQSGDLYKSEKENKGRVFRDTLKDGGEGPEMVVLPTGRFRMEDLDGDGYDPERPVRTVTISRPIAMGRYPITFEDYDRYAENWGFLKALFGKKPDDKGWGRGSRPVINVNWHDAKDYAAWLSEQTGKRYRLPSEAEWEYAERAGTETVYSCDGGVWYTEQTSPVGSFELNAFGLYDMHGNVNEWVEDCEHDNYEGAPSDGSAWGLGPRGALVPASFFGLTPSDRSRGIGFRLVQDLNP